MRSLSLLFVAFPLAAQVPGITPFQEHKAEALLREQLPCLGCHQLGGEGGRNAPSLDDVSQRRDASYISAVIADPQRIVPGAAMPRIPMPQSTRELITAYLARNTRGTTSPPPTVNPQPSTATTGAGNYARWCASCHGVTGGGDGPNARYLPTPPAVHASPARMGARSDDALYDAIAGGGRVMGKSARMPAFGETLSPAEIRALVGYIRTLCKCKGPAWSLDGSR